MSQPIRPHEGVSYAMQALDLSGANRGNSMSTGVPPIANADDGGSYSKAYAANHQYDRNQQHSLQDMAQNTMSARPQAAANAAGQVRKQMMDAATPHEQAQQNLKGYLSDVIYKTSGGGNTIAFGQLMQSNERAAVINGMEKNRIQFGSAPELGPMKQQAGQYMA